MGISSSMVKQFPEIQVVSGETVIWQLEDFIAGRLQTQGQ